MKFFLLFLHLKGLQVQSLGWRSDKLKLSRFLFVQLLLMRERTINDNSIDSQPANCKVLYYTYMLTATFNHKSIYQ